MQHPLKHHSDTGRGSRSRHASRLGRTVVLALSLVFCLAAASHSVYAAQTVLTVTDGWDVLDDPNARGYVIYSVTSAKRACNPKLQITYILQGAKPLQNYDLAFGIFNLPGDGLKSFGVPRFLRNTYTREEITATHDAFIVGKFATDRNGNGQTHVELDLAGVPAGSYNAQFTWTRLSDTRGYYRTGSKYGQGFGTIIVP